jgi:hypothetical protein
VRSGNLFLQGAAGEMSHKTFVAFACLDPFLAGTIADACELSRTAELEYEPWQRNDVSGREIGKSVFGWI